MALLNKTQFEQVRDRFNAGESTRSIAERLPANGLEEVRRAIAAPTYLKYVGNRPILEAVPRRPSTLYPGDVKTIWKLKDTMTPAAIARLYEVPRYDITNIFAGKSWKHLRPKYEANKGENRPTD
jgi:hypothetical protein